MRALSSFIRRCLARAPTHTPAPLPQPEMPICVIGDIHGRADLLQPLLAQIEARAAGTPIRRIFVGDLVDRGPASADVLAQIYALTQADPDHTFCLMGNHERMMLDFLADPATHGPRWLQAGGAETLVSFGLSPWRKPAGVTPKAHLPHLAEQLNAALPAGLHNWLDALPLIWCEDPLVVTHAALDPARGPKDQDPDTLLWGHRAFLRQPRADHLWVAHGHTIVKTPEAKDSRIAVDTGAWRSGRLTAAWLDESGLSFIESTTRSAG